MTNWFLELFKFTNCRVEMPTAVGNEHITAKTPPITGGGIQRRHAPIFGERPIVNGYYDIISYDSSFVSHNSRFPIRHSQSKALLLRRIGL